MPNRPSGRVTIRTVMLAGFGLTLGLWLFTGYQLAQRLTMGQAELSAISARYVAAQESLSTVRTQVMGMSVTVRDAMLAPAGDPGRYRTEVDRAYRTIDTVLKNYVPVRSSSEEVRELARLRAEVDAFRTASTDVLETSPDRWRLDVPELAERFVPRRQAAIAVSEHIQGINRASYIDYLQAASRVQVLQQRQVWTVLGVGLLISLGIAWVAYRYAVRLEGRLTDQRVREERISQDLQRLSARLVSVQEEERRRIARELHDEVGQALSAIGVELALAQQRLQRAGLGDDLLHGARTLADTVLRGVRDLSQVLHPSALDDLGLIAALMSHTNAFRRRAGLAVRIDADGDVVPADPEAERAVYRIVQEALTNVAKHARATSVTVRLRGRAGGFTVEVEDDGVGFDAAAAQRPGSRKGLGLLGIRERASQFGGALVVDSVEGRGTRVAVDLPVPTRSAIDPPAEEAGAPLCAAQEVTHG